MSESSEHGSGSYKVIDAYVTSSPRCSTPGAPRRSHSFDRSPRYSIKPAHFRRSVSDRSNERPGSGSGRGLRAEKPVRPSCALGSSPVVCASTTPAGLRPRPSPEYAATIIIKPIGSLVISPMTSIAELFTHRLSTGPCGQPWSVQESLDHHKKGSTCKGYRELFDDLPLDLAPGSFVLHYPAQGRAFTSKQMQHCCSPKCNKDIEAGHKGPVMLSLVVGSCKTLDDEYKDKGHSRHFTYTDYFLPHIHVFCSVACAAAACAGGNRNVDCMTPHPPAWPHSISQEQREQLAAEAPPPHSSSSSPLRGRSTTSNSPQQQGPKTPPGRTAATGNSSSHGPQRHHSTLDKCLGYLNKPKPINTSSSPVAQGGAAAPAHSPSGTAPSSTPTKQQPQQQQQQGCIGDQMANMNLAHRSPDRAARMDVPDARRAPGASSAEVLVNPTPLRLTKSTLQRFLVMKAAAERTKGEHSKTLVITDKARKDTGLPQRFLKEVWAWTKDDGTGCQEGLLLEPEVHGILATLADRRLL